MPAADEPRRQPVDASIDPTRLYRSDEAMLRMGWRPSGWRAARRAGLKFSRYGKRAFVMGADLIAFIHEHGEVAT